MKRIELEHEDLIRLWRADFPILGTHPGGKPLVYLDNAATTQKPWHVIEAEADYYRTTNANVHRGVHWLAERATDAYERARATVALLYICTRADLRARINAAGASSCASGPAARSASLRTSPSGTKRSPRGRP